jgi:LysR family hydrogen peroxide-inducible transcriptional activator
MTLQELRYLVAVARERHFGRAAALCFVSQPSLSVSIRHLEEELGVILFQRTRGKIEVTDIGREVVAQAERVLEEAARVKQIAAAGRDPLIGALRLGVIHTIAPYVLPDLVATLRRRAPHMPLDIEENQTAQLDRLLQEGVIDAALLALPFEGPGLEVTPVYTEDFTLIVPVRHAWARRRQVRTADLQAQEMLLLGAGHCLRDQILETCNPASVGRLPTRQGNSLETLRSMVASGLGITVMPATAMADRFSSPLVREVPFSAPVPARTVALAARRQFHRPAALRALIDCLGELRLPLTPIAPSHRQA